MIITLAITPTWLAAIIVAAIAAVLGVVIVIINRLFAVPVDETQESLTELLPGANCGGCGYSGCGAYAGVLVNGLDTDLTKCTVGGKDTVEVISEFLGKKAGQFVPKVAHLYCQGDRTHTHPRYDYTGTPNCASAHGLFSGPNSCTYGCMGFGDCKAVCEFGAITMNNGIAKIDSAKCTACGRCVVACPKKLIHIIPKHIKATVTCCSNHWPGVATRQNCSIGCIGCTRCVKVCPVSAITMDDNLAVINQQTCTHCGECIAVCPTHTIKQGLVRG